MYTVGFYFLGSYRPAYFQAETLGNAVLMARESLGKVTDSDWFLTRLSEGKTVLQKSNTTAWSSEHGGRGVSLAKRSHDPWLDGATRDIPAYPGLDYSQAINQ